MYLIASSFAGGAFFWLINAPAPWLIGGLAAAGTFAVCGRKEIVIQRHLQRVIGLLIGFSVGAGIRSDGAFTPNTWPVTITCMVVAMTFMFLISFIVLNQVFRWDTATAIWASLPGALSISVNMAAETSGNVERVAAVQIMRLYSSAAIGPMFFAAELPTTGGSILSLQPSGLATICCLIAGAGIGTVLERLKFPAGTLIGSLAVTMVLNNVFSVRVSLPEWVMTCTYVVFAAIIASNFTRVRVSELPSVILAALSSFLCVAAACVLSAAIVSAYTNISLKQMILAFAPGGIETVALMSLYSGSDPGFVVGHHMARLILLAFAAPLIGHLLKDRSSI